jgi:Cu/Ag efflux protein CusF
MITTRIIRGTAALGVALSLTGCASGAGGGIGDILGAVLGGAGGQQQQSGQVSGAITGVDSRNQQVGLQTSNGQNVAIRYDNQTQVVYQRQQYPVTALERGDRVTMRVQQLQNGSYYTDYIQVDQSVRQTGTGGAQQAQLFQGTVREVNVNSGWFTVNTSQYGVLTVTLPYAVSNADNTRFRSLRAGQSVRFYAVPLNNTRVELQRFD